MRVMKKSTKAWSMKMRLALLALAALVWIAVPVSARAEGGNSRYLGWHSGSFYRR